jgi:DNA-binding transcriptional MerR regulator
VTTPVIPNRPVFRSQEVCELAELQPYVLRSWESEFPDLGVAKTANGPRVYRRADVERVLRIKHLLFVDGLTLAGARKRLAEEGLSQPPEIVEDADLAAMIDDGMRQQLQDVRRGLSWMLSVLAGEGATPSDFVLTADRSSNGRAAAPARAASKSKPAASGAKDKSGAKSARNRR